MSTVIGRVMPLPKGTFDLSETYNILDIVDNEFGSWMCKVNGTTGITPSEGDNWMLLANHGSSVKTGTAITTQGSGLSGAQGIVGDKYINTDTNDMYTCVTSGTASTARWDYVTTLGGITRWSDLQNKPFDTLDEYDELSNPDGSFTIHNDELSLSTYATTRLGYVDTAQSINSALQDKISEPLTEGTAGQALITDGQGGRSWGDSSAIVNVTEAEYAALPSSEKNNPLKYWNRTELESYANVDVYDDLDGEDLRQDALSANQGYVLKGMIDSLNTSLANRLKVRTTYSGDVSSVSANSTKAYHTDITYQSGDDAIVRFSGGFIGNAWIDNYGKWSVTVWNSTSSAYNTISFNITVLNAN